MKKILQGIMVLFAFVCMGLAVSQKPVMAQETRAVWVCFYEYEKYGLYDQNEEDFRVNANKMFRRIRDNGCNTVYFHVRAFDDAIWPSDNFKFSSYMGKSEPYYDPLKILIDVAHKYGLSFHAWMNPYRITQKKVYDPGKESTRNRICLAVKEVIDNYAVDGIHFDDYFYPGSSHKQYKLYKNVKKATKKANVNQLIREVYSLVKQKNSNILFGISPAGSLEYCESIGADPETWMSEEGYIDYIVPQIYWSNNYILNGKKTRLFSDRLKEWKELNFNDIPMIIGLGLYRGGMKDSSDRGWGRSSRIVADQITKIRSSSKLAGFSLFSYDSLYNKQCKYETQNYLKRICKITISKVKREMKKGSKQKIGVSVWPNRLGQTVTYQSSRPKIMTVSKNGWIKAKRKGTAILSVIKNSKRAIVKIVIR